ncbi:MAG: rRNA maturation RNase YbeY [Flavobacteriales bacterium]|jgi:probable rRNA maturation factor|nr:rRNA maturation RNase YbeY [Flavobacteriales bacterium]
MSIYFHNEDSPYVLSGKTKIKSWLKSTIEHYKKSIGTINIVFCSDQHLLVINKEYLNHDYYTDIITFNFCENKTISGDLFISIDRIKDNSKKNKLLFVNELHRVIIHGVLHLCGFNDKTNEEKKEIRQLENYFLNQIKHL